MKNSHFISLNLMDSDNPYKIIGIGIGCADNCFMLPYGFNGVEIDGSYRIQEIKNPSKSWNIERENHTLFLSNNGTYYNDYTLNSLSKINDQIGETLSLIESFQNENGWIVEGQLHCAIHDLRRAMRNLWNVPRPLDELMEDYEKELIEKD